jgi:hypothetical protein
MTKVDDCWSDLVRNVPLTLSKSLSYVTADQLRLVANAHNTDTRRIISMTSKKELAKVLKDNDVFVLPISRAKWIVTHGVGYHAVEDPGPTVDFPSRAPFHLTTLSYANAEKAGLAHAYTSGLLERFTGSAPILGTDPGRSSTRSFDFKVDGNPRIEVKAQMEVDQCYEGPRDVLLFEAKVDFDVERDEFFIRQLYFPYRSHVLHQELTGHKPVRTFFFNADTTAKTYTIWEYRWKDEHDYEDIHLRRASRFKIVEEEVPKDLLGNVSPDPSVPFFQADDFDKVTEFPFLVQRGVKDAKAWAEHYGFALRQGSYYRAAAEALGLVGNEEGTYVLTGLGKRFLTMPREKRNSTVAELLLRMPVLNAVFDLARRRGIEGVSKEDVIRIIKEKTGLTGATPPRRASSVLSYFRWLATTTGTVVVDGQRIYSRVGWDQKAK